MSDVAGLLVRVRIELFVSVHAEDAYDPRRDAPPPPLAALVCPTGADPHRWAAEHMQEAVQGLADAAVAATSPPTAGDARVGTAGTDDDEVVVVIDPETGLPPDTPPRGPWRVRPRPRLALPDAQRLGGSPPASSRSARGGPGSGPGRGGGAGEAWVGVEVASPFEPSSARALARLRTVVAGIAARWRVLTPCDVCTLAVDLAPYTIQETRDGVPIGPAVVVEGPGRVSVSPPAGGPPPRHVVVLPSGSPMLREQLVPVQWPSRNMPSPLRSPPLSLLPLPPTPLLLPNVLPGGGGGPTTPLALPPPPPPPGPADRAVVAVPFPLPSLRRTAAFAYLTSSHVPALLRRARHDVPGVCLSVRHRSNVTKGLTASEIARLWGLNNNNNSGDNNDDGGGAAAAVVDVIPAPFTTAAGHTAATLQAAAREAAAFRRDRRAVPRGLLRLFSATLGEAPRRGGELWAPETGAEGDYINSSGGGGPAGADGAGERPFSLRRAANEILACASEEAVAALLACGREPALGSVSLANYARGAAPTLGLERPARFRNPQFAGGRAEEEERQEQEEQMWWEEEGQGVGEGKEGQEMTRWDDEPVVGTFVDAARRARILAHRRHESLFDNDPDPASRVCISFRQAGATVDADAVVLWTALWVVLCRVSVKLSAHELSKLAWGCELGERLPDRFDVLDMLAWITDADAALPSLVDALQRQILEKRYASPWAEVFQYLDSAAPEVTVVD